MKSSVEVDVNGGAVRGLPKAEIERYLGTAVAALRRRRAVKGDVGEISVHFVDDAEIKAINRKYRKINRPTDVLTFPAAENDLAEEKVFGDIIISLETAKRQAADEKHSLATEVRYLLLHGLIHGLGFDHGADEGEMNKLELSMRKTLGLE